MCVSLHPFIIRSEQHAGDVICPLVRLWSIDWSAINLFPFLLSQTWLVVWFALGYNWLDLIFSRTINDYVLNITITTECCSLFFFYSYRFHLSRHLITFRNLDDITLFLELENGISLTPASIHPPVPPIRQVCFLLFVDRWSFFLSFSLPRNSNEMRSIFQPEFLLVTIEWWQSNARRGFQSKSSEQAHRSRQYLIIAWYLCSFFLCRQMSL